MDLEESEPGKPTLHLTAKTDAVFGAHTNTVLQTLHLSKGLEFISVLTTPAN